MENIMKINGAQIKASNKIDNGGVTITFDTTDNMIIESYVLVIYDNKSHYFQISGITAYHNALLVNAKEVGYFANFFSKQIDFDVRKLIGLHVTVITDDETIKKIREMSCWC